MGGRPVQHSNSSNSQTRIDKYAPTSSGDSEIDLVAWLIEAYEVPGATLLAQSYSHADLHLLLEQTSKLRRDPIEHRKAVNKAETEAWLDDNMATSFVSADGEVFNMEEFF